ncbi:Tat pathway signal sequence [Faecalibacterium prausnitzii]|uniref:Tat pathway signal sequence domain protein n=1 Tax=Faecalibacterium prausnitzii TaxID=853 RepID=A0A173T869_9FIRM|nr:Tat pathway signal sequence [Faecalibacterium prausnitzii]CUM98279.1 Uncharacterised protein [Faecalibacterium prausnitzii]
MKDVSRREFLKTLCLGITVAALQNLPMTTAFADSAISKTKIISKSDRENLVATVARTVQVSYKIDKNTIIEVTRFTDIDGQNVTLNRSVKEDGTGELVYTKAQKTKKSKLTNQSYDVFLKLATSKSMPQTRGATVGSDVTGSQYKHIFVSNLSYTIDNTAIAQITICITKISTFLILCDLAVCLATLYVSFSLVFALMRYLQGKVFLIRFYSPTTLSSSRAEFRLPSRLACA